MATTMTTADFLDCLPDAALRRILEDIRAIKEPMARAVEADVERMIEERLARSSERAARRARQPSLFAGGTR